MEAFVLLLSAFGASGVMWAWQNRVRIREERSRQKQLSTMLDDSMQVALHLAKHAASSRNQPLQPLHVLYAITEDETVAAAIEKLGGDRAGLDAALQTAMDKVEHDMDPREGTRLLGSALGIAHNDSHRQMTIVDTLAMLLRTPVARHLDRPPITGDKLLFALIHGEVPPATLPRETHVHVVLRNDDYSSMNLVVKVLETVFALDREKSRELTMKVHDEGRAVVARLPVEDARDKIEKARELAKSEHAPLWIGAEVC
ncbi:MAG: ATP-dependent Clp protease adaptor ClpS [Kofleriaceae bacterium]